MVAIKKRKIKAYILLESLIALAVLVTIVTLILTEINRDRQELVASLHRQEVLNLAQMAVQTKQDSLSLNGVTVQVQRTSTSIRVYENGREVLHVAKN
ncbi:competence type IV pilus minor pilin ComGE [Streptococcus sobrinus]|uniref:Prepilin-type cleavage/methylation protein n=4 Tax=Streptococcus sobrinus TaxID=1310 RepID=U2IVP9_9STRE|nr:competence type IV pilus minor pilin ComGE [Streptococcus sobrinus]AWN18093.1 Type II secretory pathway, pseudopilin PulG [Streptococcus sobrinus]AWN19998.1 Type II secretory pathway, pseudopilin PulG [Streptococcus sobrinus]AWN60853.1 Type II secretory pathway, pseudopilin PulG [Streptococcus sobrinus]AWN62725.1 Type II secretory pathway, pseudopilin PulG [Streptococcus sobrinus]EMP72816.1 Type II secretory pathway, pseudopilin PulG [Streptococcus sobrinus DSM 20742 = ATCC 33478]